MCGKKLLGRLTGVIPCPIMDEKQMFGGVSQNHLQDRLVTVRGKPAINTLREQTPREILNGPKDFVAFALAARTDLRLLAAPRPRIAQRAPLRKAGLILKEDQAFT